MYLSNQKRRWKMKSFFFSNKIVEKSSNSNIKIKINVAFWPKSKTFLELNQRLS